VRWQGLLRGAPASDVEQQRSRHHPEHDVGEQRLVADQDLRRIAALLALVDEVEVAKDPEQDERDRQIEKVVPSFSCTSGETV
jgi:hypothetical protein